jgi:hypothetical protein
MGARDGSIIATIIATHMPMNDAAALGHVCPHIRIHAIDIVQPPGIGISPIADMDAHQTIVTAAQAAKSSAETPNEGPLGNSFGNQALRHLLSSVCANVTHDSQGLTQRLLYSS